MADKKTTEKQPTKKEKRAEERVLKQAKKIEDQLEFERKHRIHDEIGAIVCIALGVFLIFAMQTTKVGVVGSALKSVFLGVFGRVAFVLPYLLCVYGLLLLFKLVKPMAKRSLLLFIAVFLLLSAADSVRFVKDAEFVFSWEAIKGWYASAQTLESGGSWGMAIAMLLVKVIGSVGTYILGVAGILVSLLLAVRRPISEVALNAKEKAEEIRKEREEQKALKEEERAKRDEIEAAERAKREAREAEERAKQLELDLNGGEKYSPVNEKKKKGIVALVSDMSLFKKDEEPEPVPDTPLGLDPVPDAPDSEYDDVDASTKEPEETGLKYGIEEPVFVPAGFGLESSEEAGKPGEDGDVPAGGYEAAKGDLNASDLFKNSRKTPETSFVKKDTGEDGLSAFAGRRTASEGSSEGDKASAGSAASAPRPYRFPPISLLAQNKQPKNTKEDANLLESSRRLEAALRTFNVEATVTNVTKGPTVTRYELQPQPGVKVSQIKNLADDIALTLAAKSLRIEAPIPGKSAVGIEIENERINMITFRECVESREFQTARSKISAAIGKDIGGASIICNLKDMPHLLIAGATGAGKSVCVNSIIMSILYKAKPDEVKLIMIDPKKVELSNYNGIPHLLAPVVTDTSKAAGTLSWCVAEMMRRYQLFADEGVRDRQSYNEAMIANEEPEKVLPFIVIIIDELADLMMASGKQVEPAICRIGQLARAAGMHMVIATQSPRVDVITGLIKANIPSRIALMCSQRVDSMVILDEPGAEKLVGKGDMLFLGAGASKPTRIQGCFVSDDEINKTVEYIIKNNAAGVYSEEIQTSMANAGLSGGNGDTNDDNDEGVDASLLQEAIQSVVKAQACSVSMLQRKFRIGYNHAARLVDAMEARGIIGPQDGTRPRKVLMTEAQYNALGDDTD
ncbi:MAG: DNA translocase FtsK [Firmicutes bacterium]|nr:DNA translocase FtsK [Bacillota bacterium]